MRYGGIYLQPRLTMVTLGVADLERSVSFYCDGLGLPCEPGPKGIAFFLMGETRLALYPTDALAADVGTSASFSGFRGFTLAHNVESKARVDEVLMEAIRAGASLERPAAEAEWGGYSGYISDPDGFVWEVAWNPHLSLP